VTLRVLVELTMTEQRYRAVLEVEAGVPVTEVAERFGVSRQAVHRWIGWYRDAWRVYDDDILVAEVARTTTKSVAGFKVHKPEPPRRKLATASAPGNA
jgi:hypothetical protein